MVAIRNLGQVTRHMTEQVRRATRLVEIERLLRKRTQGWSARELAEEVGYSQRTVQRDIAALESELNVPLMLEGRRYRIMPDAGALAPVRFTLQEARALYLATRLFLRHADDRDPDGITALDKLANALPEPIARQVAMTVLQLRERPAQKEENAILCRITEGWARSHTVAIRYRSFQDLSIRSTSLDPYLLEPSATGAATYVIGFSHGHDAVRTFKVERITHAEVTGASFEPPDTSEITRRLAHSWGVVFGMTSSISWLSSAPPSRRGFARQPGTPRSVFRCCPAEACAWSSSCQASWSSCPGFEAGATTRWLLRRRSC